MNAPRWVRRATGRLKPSHGCPRCTGPVGLDVMTGEPHPKEMCTCVERCESYWCQVTRISSGSFLHTHRVQSDADRLFDATKGIHRRDRARYPWQRN